MWGPAFMTRPLSMDIRDRAMVRLDLGEEVPVREVADALSVAPCQCREMVAAQADRLRSRMASAFTLRGLVAELEEPGPGRGLKVDYRTKWKFAHSAGLSFKKNRSGQ